MNAVSLALVTFVVWITAKGRFPQYASLATTSATPVSPVGSSAGSGSTNSPPTVRPLPELPPVGQSYIDQNALNVWNNGSGN